MYLFVVFTLLVIMCLYQYAFEDIRFECPKCGKHAYFEKSGTYETPVFIQGIEIGAVRLFNIEWQQCTNCKQDILCEKDYELLEERCRELLVIIQEDLERDKNGIE